MKKIFAAASIGGHWKQLLRITKSLDGQYEVVYASTHPNCASMTEGGKFYLLSDFSRSDAWRIIPSFFRLLRILRHERPAAVLTTGAAPGLVCILAGWLLRYKTIWVDSTANAAELSGSGRIASHFASRVYTQWPDLAQNGVVYAGTVWGIDKNEERKGGDV